MMYRNFAIAILLAAPIIVMGVQSIEPKPAQSAAAVASTQSAMPAIAAVPSYTAPEQPAPEAVPALDVPASAPIPDAGKPIADMSGGGSNDALTVQVDGQ
jgi:hypothetical protein